MAPSFTLMPPFPQHFYASTGCVIMMWGWFEDHFNLLLRGILHEAGQLENSLGWESRRYKSRRESFRRFGPDVLSFCPPLYAYLDAILHESVPPSRKRNALVHGAIVMHLTLQANTTISQSEAIAQDSTSIVTTTTLHGKTVECVFTKSDLDALWQEIHKLVSRLASYEHGFLIHPGVSSEDIARLRTLVASASPLAPSSQAFQHPPVMLDPIPGTG